MTALLFALVALTSLSEWKGFQCEGQPVAHRYVNSSRGFSVDIPPGLQGRCRGAAGPDVGVGIPLSTGCDAVISVYAEPNSLEWSSPRAAIDFHITAAREQGEASARRYSTQLGPLPAFGAVIHHGDSDDVEHIVVAFRPNGGPVYVARLATTKSRLAKDVIPFNTVMKSFRLEPWR